MDAKSISAMEAIRDDPVLAVNLKAGKMLNMLGSLGYIRIQNLKPSQLLVHPENRSGATVNPFNVHQKGWQALKVGWSAKKLEESYALEVSHNWSVKHKQLQAMQTLVEASQGMLAPVAGTEQYMSLSASHMSQFCKAVGAGCLTQDENLASINKVLSLDTLQQTFPDAGFKEAVTQGWRWHCIAFTVEESMPWFAVPSGSPECKQSHCCQSNRDGAGHEHCWHLQEDQELGDSYSDLPKHEQPEVPQGCWGFRE